VSQQETDAGLGLAVLSAQGFHWVLRLIRRLHGPLPVWEAGVERLKGLGVKQPQIDRYLAARDGIDLPRMKEAVDASGSCFIPYGSARIPPLVRELAFAPAGLFVAGDPSLFDEFCRRPRAVVVGTRKASSYGLANTSRLVAPLVAAGVVVVSGLALGIDAAAHRAAVEAGGLTVAVLGCGTDIVYPARNGALRRRILDYGLLVSEFPPGMRPTRWTFPLRNRIMAALGHGVIVVEAGSRSGALITVEHALELGRTIFAVPGPVFVEGSAGVNRLIYEGACPIIDPDFMVEEFARDTRNEMGKPCMQAPGAAPAASRRGDEGGASVTARNLILQALYRGPRTIDEAAACTGLEVCETARGIGLLELSGLVRQSGPGRYSAV